MTTARATAPLSFGVQASGGIIAGMDSIEISPAQAVQRQRDGATVVDVRGIDERVQGQAAGAQAIELARVLDDPAQVLPDTAAPLLMICARGQRSLRAVQALREAGYSDVHSVAGGTQAWIAAGLPVEQPAVDAAQADFLQRYSRHFRLPQVGINGQQQLQAARVLIIGAGGLGSPAAFYLAAAGVGHLRLVDDDRVERSNLQRQILHTEASVGTAKVDSARARLLALNPHVQVEAIAQWATAASIDALMEGVDVVLDGSDNFPLRYLLNDACIKHAKPLVYAAIERFDGQLSVFDAGRQRGVAPCYRCLFPEPPAAADAPNCAEAGVLGVLPGLAGVMQATEVLKLLLGIGQPLVGRLLRFDALGMRFRETRLLPDPDCALCAPSRAFPGYIDYAAFCAGH
jgi:molybdopterin/thiamine biosynthesis adenylyltransferase/rhodanese-related sulfurtransferase